MMTPLHSNPSIVRVANVMVRGPTAVGFQTPLRDTAKLLACSRADALLVMDDDGRLAGLLTERELVLGAQAEAQGAPGHAGHYVSPRFVIAREQESLEALLRRMVVRGVRRAVVLDDVGSPCGLVSVLMGIPMGASPGAPRAGDGERPALCL